ncbi:hypothetical protein BU17DRAFT_97342 [Hysterangium stoloniferum]|nr:hypothetical protein BU17DRAFT_97342 [Hysterangium stoloniferum]
MANILSDLERQPLALELREYDTSRKLTNRQMLYLTIFQGVGSAILDGGINFGLGILP